MDVFTVLNRLGVDKVSSQLSRCIDYVNVVMPKDDEFSKFTSRKDFCMLAGIVGLMAADSYPYEYQSDSLIRDVISKSKDLEKILSGSDALFFSIHSSTFQAYALAIAAFAKNAK